MTKVRTEIEVDLDVQLIASAFTEMDSAEQAEFFSCVHHEMLTWGDMKRQAQMHYIVDAMDSDAHGFFEGMAGAIDVAEEEDPATEPIGDFVYPIIKYAKEETFGIVPSALDKTKKLLAELDSSEIKHPEDWKYSDFEWGMHCARTKSTITGDIETCVYLSRLVLGTWSPAVGDTLVLEGMTLRLPNGSEIQSGEFEGREDARYVVTAVYRDYDENATLTVRCHSPLCKDAPDEERTEGDDLMDFFRG